MAIETLGAAVRQINRLFADGSVTGLSDAQLLERFVGRRDAASFEALVARHGPMVLSVCHGILRDPNDADDAFQATFLILVKKAGTIGGRVVLGGWLYQVAHRVAIQANIAAARRRAREREAGKLKTASTAFGPVIGDDLLPALHAEIARLPEKYRLPILLCELEGLSQAQAAGQLRWSERTLRRRLVEARDLLKSRLARRGLTPDNAMLGALFVREARVAVPAVLNERTIRAALDLVYHTIAAGTVSAAARSLTKKVLQMMLVQRLKWASAALLAAGAGGIVAATFAVDSNDEPRRRDQPPGVIASKPEPKREFTEAAGEGRKPVSIAGRVLGPDGEPVPAAKIYVRHSHWFDRGEERRAVEQPTTAGPDGRFRIDLDPSKSDAPIGDGPPWHAAMIAAVAPGYGPAWITAGEAATGGAELRLVRDDLPVRGRILDSQGRPVAGANVRVELLGLTRDRVDLDALLIFGKLDWDGTILPTIRQPFWSSPTWVGRNGAVTTDEDGRFALVGLGRDRAALLRIEGRGTEHGRIAVLCRTPPGARRAVGQASPTFDTVNGELGLELYGTTFEHVVGPSKPISGVVRLQVTGRAVAGVTIAAQVAGRVWTAVMTKTDERGHFRLDGLPKSPSYQVDVRPSPGASYLGRNPQTVSDTEGLKPIAMTFELSRGVAVQGRLIDKQTGRAVPCDWVVYFPLPNNPHRGSIHGTASGTDDTFRITVPPGGGMIAVKARGKSLPYPGARLVPADKGKLQIKGEDGSEFGIPLSIYQAYRFVDYGEGTESATLDLEVKSGISRKVELVGRSGRPVTGASAMGLTIDKFASTTIDGARFDVQGLRPVTARSGYQDNPRPHGCVRCRHFGPVAPVPSRHVAPAGLAAVRRVSRRGSRPRRRDRCACRRLASPRPGHRLGRGDVAMLARLLRFDQPRQSHREAGGPDDDLGTFLRRSLLDAYATADRLDGVARHGDARATFPECELARRLLLAAGLIKAGLRTRVYYMKQGDYDTHGHQLARHAPLLEDLCGSIKAFLDDLSASRLAERVVVMVFSEFGRRVQENGSMGTDHGTAGPVFLAGPGVKPGLVGSYPSLIDLQDGDLKMTVDFRRVYASILENWLGLPSHEAVGGSFEPMPLFSR